MVLVTLSYFVPRGDLCSKVYKLFKNLAKLVATTHACPLVDFPSCLEAHVYLGLVRYSLQRPPQVVKLNIRWLS